MSSSECKPELWTLKNVYEALTFKGNDSKRRIVIPMFQRGLRWDEDKENTFIDSLTHNYPVGSLLFYKTMKDNIEYYTLIDGLQRGNTIKKFMQNPNRYFKSEDIPESLISIIYACCGAVGNETFHKSNIKELISNYVSGNGKIEDIEALDLFQSLYNIYPALMSKLSTISNEMQIFIKNYKKQYENLAQTQIPVIVYSGEESTLHAIFERINSKGVPLTQYEIYAASWPKEKFKIENDSILEYVMKRYDKFNDGEFTIEGYDHDQFRKEKMVTAFDYVFGLSKYIYNTFPNLKFGGNMGDDEINHLAFELLNACFNDSFNEIKNVHETILKFKDNISMLEERLFECIKFVDSCISNITKFKANNKSGSAKIYHSQWQIMSYVSFVFRQRYDLNTLKTKDTWKASKKVLEGNLWKYYIYDIVEQFWSQGGTRNLHACNNEYRYMQAIPKEQFASTLDSYYEKSKMRHEKTNVASPDDEEFVILNAIYQNIFTAMDTLSVNNKFDVEHICTKDQMKKYIRDTESEGLPISSLANLCYLPEHENRSKGSFNFYQDDNYLKHSDYSLEAIEDKFSFTKKEDLDWMDLGFTKGDSDVLRDCYIEFLDKRYLKLKEVFLRNLGYIETK